MRRSASGVEFQVEGSGPPLVLLAGFGHTSTVWSAILPRLASAFTCVTLDNRGVGAGAGRGEVSIPAMADDVADVIEELGGRASVVGWSMGGAIAQMLAIGRPDLLDALVLLSTSGRRSHVQRLWTSARLDLAETCADREAGEMALLPWMFTHRVLSDHRRLTAIARSNTAGEAPDIAGLRAQAAAFEDFDVTADLPRVQIRTLVIVGSEDLVTPTADSIAIAMALPDAELVVLPFGGHAVVLESPSDVVPPIMRFLRETLAESPREQTRPILTAVH